MMENPLIVSDLHLDRRGRQMGSATGDEIATYLDGRMDADTDYCIMVGDIVELWTGEKFSDKRGQFNAVMRQNPIFQAWLFRRMSEGRLIYIAGNHDLALLTQGILPGVVESYTTTINGRIVHFEHGHSSDWFNSDGRIIGRTLTFAGGWLTRVPGIDRQRLYSAFARFVQPGRQQSVLNFREHWLRKARRNGWDLVCLGHVHAAEAGAGYANSGTWINNKRTLLRIERGRPIIEHWRL